MYLRYRKNNRIVFYDGFTLKVNGITYILMPERKTHVNRQSSAIARNQWYYIRRPT